MFRNYLGLTGKGFCLRCRFSGVWVFFFLYFFLFTFFMVWYRVWVLDAYLSSKGKGFNSNFGTCLLDGNNFISQGGNSSYFNFQLLASNSYADSKKQ